MKCDSPKIYSPPMKIMLVNCDVCSNYPTAQYARACGRVSVGGDPDKRPVNHPLNRPAAGGKPAHPAKRGTRLEATTDRAFLVSVGPPKAYNRRGLSILPGVRKGLNPLQTMAV